MLIFQLADSRLAPRKLNNWRDKNYHRGLVDSGDTIIPYYYYSQLFILPINNYLIQVQQYLSLSDVTLHLAVANFDLVLSSVEVEDDEVQLLGLVCLNLAAKVEEDCPRSPDLVLPLTGDMFNKADLARVKKKAITAVK